ncbi:hypothetical protein PT974_01363 [Cladobotryum mycophilum]|uniref:Heterokaryon incompatibility domain-containing protein n=1 Tax=Cladobotryum mycophilum TaxID=491253 RepID=A0ABR0T3F0_9HYPO
MASTLRIVRRSTLTNDVTVLDAAQFFQVGDLCDNVLKLLEEGHDGYLEHWTRKPIFFGTYDGIASHATSSDCPVCTLILKMIPLPVRKRGTAMGVTGLSTSSPTTKSDEYYITAATHSELMMEMMSLSFTTDPEEAANMRRIHIHDGKGKSHGQMYYFPADSTELSAAFLRSQNELSPSLLANWIANCSYGHGEQDGTALEENLASSVSIELTFIDVVDLCLVRSSSKARYLSLSYVWGKVSGLQLKASNRRDLEVPQALARLMSEIPRTITDAMHLTRQMGERFLWVDSLCIEQDNTFQKHFNISQMNIVYSRSVATLAVVAGHDASCPIPGVTSSRLRLTEFIDLRRTSLQQQPGCLVAEFPGYFEDTFKNSKYETRAWTMQERLLSLRCIFLTDRAAYLYCQHGFLSCDSNHCLRRRNRIEGRASRKISATINPFQLLDKQSRMTASQSPVTIMSIYTALVHQYTARKLSYDVDSLNAFSGMLTALHDMSGIEPFSGLLRDVVEHCLFWVPVCDSDSTAPVTRTPGFPSWSWAGWKGPKSYFNGPLYLHDFPWKGYSAVGREPSLSLDNEHILFHAFNGIPEQGNPGLMRDRLCITTRVADAVEFLFVKPRAGKTYGTVRLARNSELCGFYYHLELPSSRRRRTSNIQLMELSASACLIDRHWQPRGVPGAHFMNNVDQDSLKSLRCLTLVHVMIAEWQGRRLERVGLASIQSEIWDQMKLIKGSYIMD